MLAREGINFPDNIPVMGDFEVWFSKKFSHDRIFCKYWYTQVAMREEWRSVFPTHRMKGCSFHFNKVNLLKNVTNCKYQDQALLKRVCDDGKLTLYNSPLWLERPSKASSGWDFRFLLSRLLGELNFWKFAKFIVVIIIRLNEALVAMREAITQLDNPQVEEWCTHFVEYLEQTWIRGVAQFLLHRFVDLFKSCLFTQGHSQ